MACLWESLSPCWNKPHSAGINCWEKGSRQSCPAQQLMLQLGILLQDFIPWAFPSTASLMICWSPSALGGGGGGGRLSHSTFWILQHSYLLLSFSPYPSPLQKGLMFCAAVWSHFPTTASTSLLEGRLCISCGFNSSTSHHARHKSTIKHMNISLRIYGPAWELRGFWMLLSGSASEINIIPSGFELIVLFYLYIPKGKT